jgi:tetratricopeptide (TPR) repeat protein
MLSMRLSAQTGQIDSSKSLFTVLAAINAAGYDANLSSPANHPLRKAIRDEVARRKPPVLDELRTFVRQHRQDTDAAHLRLFVSYALLTEGPPKFAWRIKEFQLPPDVGAMKDLAPLLEKFYTQAGVEELWQRSQPALEQFIARYQRVATRAITEASAYLRAPLGGTFLGHRYSLVVDLLGAPNNIFFLPYLDDYFLVVTHSPEPHFNDIRQSYLQYLLDPLVTRWAEKIDEKKALGDYAQAAAHLADHYKQDFLLLTTKSLIRAIETRLEPGASKRKVMVDQAMAEGFVLAAHFAEQLPVYEKQEAAMRMYFPDLISSIDLSKEEKRLESFRFTEQRIERKAKIVAPPPAPELSPAETLLGQAEELYAARDLDKASEAWRQVVAAASEKPLQAKAYYGLARIAALRRDPETAEKLFQQALQSDPPPAEKAWTLVYLARLSQAAGEAAQAGGYFKAAIEVAGGSDKARDAARKGLDELEKRK